MEEKIIEIRDVRKTYQLYEKPVYRLKEALSPTKKSYHTDHFALDRINLDVYRGECVGIIGTNGSGKSTLLKIVTGVLNPTEGEVTVHGKISALLELGTGFNPDYSGMENIFLSGTMSGFTREEMEKKVDDIVEFAEIGEFIDQPVKTYSSGMFARLAFAVAINVDPEILIVDEALSVGDIFFQSKCFRKFNEFKEAGKTILFVSHDIGSIIKYCDRALLIHQGKQISVGKASEVVDIYRKILVNQYEEEVEQEVEQEVEKEEAEESLEIELSENQAVEKDDIGRMETAGNLREGEEAGTWKSKMLENPNYLDYGNGQARIVDFGIFDETGKLNTAIYKGKEFTLKMKIHFNEDISNPIFAFTIKDLKGTEITGTNTMLEDKMLELRKKNEEVVVSFKQKMDIQGGQYLISLGCTGYEAENFVVYNRLYDICNLQVISDRNTVGFYDMNSIVEYE